MHELCTVDRPQSQDYVLAQSEEQLRKQYIQDQHARSNTKGWLSRTECYVDMARHWVAWRHKMWASADTGAVRSPDMTVGQRTVRATVSHPDGYRDKEFLVTNKFRKRVKNVVTSKGIQVGVECKWVKWCEVQWCWVKWFCFEVKWSAVSYGEVLVDTVSCTLGWPYTDGTWLYCDYFIWCVSCAVVVLTCFVMCGCVYVGVCVCGGVLLICVLVYTMLFIVCTAFLYCFAYVYLFLFVLFVLV